MIEQAYCVSALKAMLCVPINASCNIPEWLQDEALVTYDKTDSDYKKACNQVLRETALMNFNQICELVKQSPGPMWLSRGPGYYMDVDQSLEVVLNLLDMQYPGKTEEFVQRLFNICERVEKKRNSMFILGPPNSGKSWFFDMITSFYLNVGYVGNFNKYCAFPLNDCIDRRVLMWNEPNIESSAYDTVKMLAGGDPCPANVKYQSGCTITRTPLFFTSNSRLFDENDAVWSSRIYFEKWQKASILKEVSLFPHPMTWKKLVERYIIN